MKRTLSALAIALASLLAAGTARAQTALEEIEADRLLSAHNYRAYPVPDTAQAAYPLTPAPEGYEPFYISTFARHGSRYLTDMDDYLMPLRALRRADSLGVLTPLGRQALAVVDSMARMARGRIGELTPRGARQHRGIAGRMYRNFPQVFAAGARIHARSTQVPRVMLSMTAQCLRLQALNPSLAITNSASERDLAVLTPPSTPRVDSIGRLPLLADVQRRFQARHLRPARLMGTLFSDPAYAATVDSIALMRKLFSVAAIMQSHDTGLELLSLFTPRECYELWRCNNLAWYLPYCNSPLTQGLMPFRAADLLLDLLDCASQALSDGPTGCPPPTCASATTATSCPWPPCSSWTTGADPTPTPRRSTPTGAATACSPWPATSSSSSTATPMEATRCSRCCSTSAKPACPCPPSPGPTTAGRTSKPTTAPSSPPPATKKNKKTFAGCKKNRTFASRLLSEEDKHFIHSGLNRAFCPGRASPPMSGI